MIEDFCDDVVEDFGSVVKVIERWEAEVEKARLEENKGVVEVIKPEVERVVDVVGGRQINGDFASYAFQMKAVPSTGVAEILDGLKLSQYAPLFEKGDVDTALLLTLDDDALEEIGVDSSLSRKKILQYIATNK